MLEDLERPSEDLESDAFEGSRWITVTCPLCGEPTLMKCPRIVLHVALKTWNHMNLYADCCEVYWDASQKELRDIRDALRFRRIAY
jgi:hypothetical protein